MIHFKDRDPKETVEIVKKFFTDRGLTIQEVLFQRSEANTYASRIEIFYKNLLIVGSNGKGLTPELCWASAYAESYERFCNLYGPCFNYTFQKAYFKNNLEKYGYYYTPGEKELSIDDIKNTPEIWKYLLNCLGTEKNILEYLSVISKTSDNKIIGVPMKHIGNNSIKYYDPRLYLPTVHSKGLSAGNTVIEALNQGISEIFEDEAWDLILFKPLSTLYEIDRKYITDSTLLEKINNIEKSGNIFKSFDMSYITGTPVIMSILLNPINYETHINIGTFPVFEIALERSITEMYQGIQIYSKTSNNLQIPGKTNITILDNFKNNYTQAPFIREELLNNIKVCAPSDVFMNREQATSSEIIFNYYKKLIEEKGYNIYYKDNSLIPEMAAVSIYCPEVVLESDDLTHFEKTSKLIKNDALNNIKLVRDLVELINDTELTMKELDFILDEVYKQFQMYETIGTIYGSLLLCDDINPIYNCQGNSCLTLALKEFTYGTYNNPNDIFIGFDNSIFFSEVRKYLTLQKYIRSNLYTNEEIKQFFSNFNIEITDDDINNYNFSDYLAYKCFYEPFKKFIKEDLNTVVNFYKNEKI